MKYTVLKIQGINDIKRENHYQCQSGFSRSKTIRLPLPKLHLKHKFVLINILKAQGRHKLARPENEKMNEAQYWPKKNSV